MFLTATTQSITIQVDAAATATESDVAAHYVDYAAASTDPGNTVAATSGTTPVTVVPAPAAAIIRHLQFLTIYNADTVSHSYTVSMVTAAGTHKVVTMRLQSAQAIQYTKADGWKFVPTANPQHQEVSETIIAGAQWTDALLVQAGDAVSVSIGGTGWEAAVYVQRMLDGETWNSLTLPNQQTSATAPIELTYIADETGYLRIGVPTGMFVSGSIPVRLGVH